MNNIPRHDDADRSTEAMLDQLGEMDRRSPSTGFEDRLMTGIRHAVLEPLGQPIPIASRSWMRLDRAALALAASIMVAVTGAMLYFASSPEPVQPILVANSAADEFDEYIETVAWLDESLPQFGSLDSADTAAPDVSLDGLLLNVQETLQGTGETG